MLTILIPSITERRHLCDNLVRVLQIQASHYGVAEQIDIIICEDNKEASIGFKRDYLSKQCRSEYCVFLDDDDDISDDYLLEVFNALEGKPDCVTYLEGIYSKGNMTGRVIHSNSLSTWCDAVYIDGKKYKHGRTPFCKDVIKTEIVKKIGFKDIRYGEDKDFADRLKASGLIKSEVHINEVMYIYNMPEPMNRQAHNKRYGIK